MKLQFLLLLFVLISCKQRQPNISSSKSDTGDKLPTIENIHFINPTDTLGTLISKIEFKLKATKEDLKIFDDGIVPWISLEEPNREISRLINADEIVLPFSNVILLIEYPLTNAVTFNLSATGKGFSRKQLIQEISKKYHEVYKEEEATAATKTIPIEKREGLINRNETNGKYGVWGHDLADLDLSFIEVYKNPLGKIYLFLDIES